MKAALLFLWWLIYRTSAHGRASIEVTPSRSQYFEYDQVSLSCQHSSSGPWTVWRYTTTGLNLSHCGSDWGSQMSSTCDMKTVKPSDSGVYWCESRERESSNAINITVTGNRDKPVILDSPVLPVTEGNDVTLRCTAGSSSNLAAEFYRYDRSIGTGSTGHMTIRHFSKSDEGEYKCSISGHGESPPSWVLLKDYSDPASLTASPNSSQWFEYDDLFLSCAVSSSRHKWVIKRSTTTNLSSCGEQWGTLTSSGCIVKTAKQADSGIYWCESPARQRSNSVQMTVYDKQTVILQSPVLPVKEGEETTLRCKTKSPPSSLTAAFYKDGSLIGEEPTGHMIIPRVSKADEGLYTCDISGHGASPPSWLFVRGVSGLPANHSADAVPDTPALTVTRCIVVGLPYLVSTVLMISVYRQRPRGRKPSISMTTLPPGEDEEGLDPHYDDAIAGVTTEHQF